MILDDIDYEFLIYKYQRLGYAGKMLEKRLRMIDPYVSLNMLRIINPDINLWQNKNRLCMGLYSLNWGI